MQLYLLVTVMSIVARQSKAFEDFSNSYHADSRRQNEYPGPPIIGREDPRGSAQRVNTNENPANYRPANTDYRRNELSNPTPNQPIGSCSGGGQNAGGTPVTQSGTSQDNRGAAYGSQPLQVSQDVSNNPYPAKADGTGMQATPGSPGLPGWPGSPGSPGQSNAGGESCKFSGLNSADAESYRNIMTKVFTLDTDLVRLKKESETSESVAQAAQEQMDTLSNQVIVIRTQVKWAQSVAMLHSDQNKVAELNLQQHNKLLSDLKRQIDELKGQLITVELQKCRKRREAIAVNRPPPAQQRNAQASNNDNEAQLQRQIADLEAKAMLEANEVSTCESIAKAAKKLLESSTNEIATLRTKLTFAQQESAAAGKRAVDSLNQHRTQNQLVAKAQEERDAAYAEKAALQLNMNSKIGNVCPGGQRNVRRPSRGDTEVRRPNRGDSEVRRPNRGVSEVRRPSGLDSERGRRAKREIQVQQYFEDEPHYRSDETLYLTQRNADKFSLGRADCKKGNKEKQDLLTAKAVEQMLNGGKEEYRKVIQLRLLEESRVASEKKEVQRAEQAVATSQKHLREITEKSRALKNEIATVQQEAEKAAEETKHAQNSLAKHEQLKFKARKRVDALYQKLTNIEASDCSRNKRSKLDWSNRLGRHVVKRDLDPGEGRYTGDELRFPPMTMEDVDRGSHRRQYVAAYQKPGPMYMRAHRRHLHHGRGHQVREPSRKIFHESLPNSVVDSAPYLESAAKNLETLFGKDEKIPVRKSIQSYDDVIMQTPYEVQKSQKSYGEPERIPYEGEALKSLRGYWQHPGLPSVQIPITQYANIDYKANEFSPGDLKHTLVPFRESLENTNVPSNEVWAHPVQASVRKHTSAKSQSPENFNPILMSPQQFNLIPFKDFIRQPLYEEQIPLESAALSRPSCHPDQSSKQDHVDNEKYPTKIKPEAAPMYKEKEVVYEEYQPNPASSGAHPNQDALQQDALSGEFPQKQQYNHAKEQASKIVPAGVTKQEQQEWPVEEKGMTFDTDVPTNEQNKFRNDHPSDSDQIGLPYSDQNNVDKEQIHDFTQQDTPLIEQNFGNKQCPIFVQPYIDQNKINTNSWMTSQSTNFEEPPRTKSKHNSVEMDPEYNKVMQDIYVAEAKVKMEGVEISRIEKAVVAHHRLLDASLSKLDELNRELTNLKREGAWAAQNSKQAQNQLIAHDTRLYTARKKVGAAIALETDIEKYMATHTSAETGKIRQVLGSPYT